MSASRTFLLLLLTALTFGCARRDKAKTAVITTPATTTAPTPATAATRAPVPTGAARDLTDVMTDELGLNADQQVKIRAILATTVDKVNTARTKYGSNRTALMTELKQINASSESQLKETLTAEQYQQYQVKKRSMQEQMRARRQGQ